VPASARLPPLAGRTVVLIEIALALGGFGIGTGEFSIMGLMPDVAGALGVDEPAVGHLISAYALGVMVGAPVLALLGSKLPRRTLLLLLMGFYAAGNLASAAAPEYGSLMLFRFIAGLPHGAYFGVAALVAATMAPPEHRAKAVSRVMIGLTVATLIGNPLATWLGQAISWRASFALVGGISLATMLMIRVFLPNQPAEPRSSVRRELAAFGDPRIWSTLAIGAVGFAGLFCVFSYLAPTLLEVTRTAPSRIPVALASFGLGCILGNLVGGRLFDRLAFRAVPWVLGWSIALLLLFPLAAQSFWSILLSTFTVGTMVALSPILQTHLMDIAAEAQTLAAASNHAAFNLANALGPFLGGIAIHAGLGWTSTGYVGAAMAFCGLLIYYATERSKTHARPATA